MRTNVIRRTLIPAVLVLSLALTACPHTPPNLSPHDTAVFNASSAVAQLTMAKNIIIDLNVAHAPNPPIINDHIAGILLDTIAAVGKVIDATPDGWLAAAKVAFEQGKARLTPTEQAQYVGYLALIQVVFTLVQK